MFEQPKSPPPSALLLAGSRPESSPTTGIFIQGLIQNLRTSEASSSQLPAFTPATGSTSSAIETQFPVLTDGLTRISSLAPFPPCSSQEELVDYEDEQGWDNLYDDVDVTLPPVTDANLQATLLQPTMTPPIVSTVPTEGKTFSVYFSSFYILIL